MNALLSERRMDVVMRLSAKIKQLYLWVIAVPLLITLLGAASNQLVLVANGDRFPVSVNIVRMQRFTEQPITLPDGVVMLDDVHCVASDKTHLNWLADEFDMHTSVMSIGDFLLELGAWLWSLAPIVWATLVVRKLVAYGRTE